LKKIKTYTIFALIIAVVIGFLIWDGCQSRNQVRDFGKQMAKFSTKEQSFIKTIDKQNREIAEQNQIILTKEQAIQQGLINYTKLKKVKSQVRIITKIGVDTIFIPFNDVDFFNDDLVKVIDTSKIILVPKPFSKQNEWYWIGGKILKRGIKIDSIQFINKQTITIGEKKLKGIKNIFKRKIPTVEIINESPYVSVQGLQNIVIKKKPKKWWQTTGFKVVAAFSLGVYTTIKVL